MAGHIKNANDKTRKRGKRKVSIRLRINGTADRPRLSVFRSAKHVYAQAIDDVTGRVIASASDTEEGIKTGLAGRPKKERARQVGKVIGEKLLAKKIEAVVFDRNGFIYHGRVKEVADGARDAGLKF
jgi:large subunit ribosomal protein L18